MSETISTGHLFALAVSIALLVAVVVPVAATLRSPLPVSAKVFWTMALILLPVVGVLAWVVAWLVGRRRRSERRRSV
jgi:hypothetical protein